MSGPILPLEGSFFILMNGKNMNDGSPMMYLSRLVVASTVGTKTGILKLMNNVIFKASECNTSRMIVLYGVPH